MSNTNYPICAMYPATAEAIPNLPKTPHLAYELVTRSGGGAVFSKRAKKELIIPYFRALFEKEGPRNVIIITTEDCIQSFQPVANYIKNILNVDVRFIPLLKKKWVDKLGRKHSKAEYPDGTINIFGKNFNNHFFFSYTPSSPDPIDLVNLTRTYPAVKASRLEYYLNMWELAEKRTQSELISELVKYIGERKNSELDELFEKDHTKIYVLKRPGFNAGGTQTLFVNSNALKKLRKEYTDEMKKGSFLVYEMIEPKVKFTYDPKDHGSQEFMGAHIRSILDAHEEQIGFSIRLPGSGFKKDHGEIDYKDLNMISSTHSTSGSKANTGVFKFEDGQVVPIEFYKGSKIKITAPRQVNNFIKDFYVTFPTGEKMDIVNGLEAGLAEHAGETTRVVLRKMHSATIKKCDLNA